MGYFAFGVRYKFAQILSKLVITPDYQNGVIKAVWK